MKKRIVSLITAMLMTCSLLPKTVTANSASPLDTLNANQAMALFDNSVQTKNFSEVAVGSRDSKKYAVKDGKYGLELDKDSGGQATELYFNLNDRFAKEISDGSVFEIEVEYFGQGDGFFQLVYDGQKRTDRRMPTVCTGKDDVWKTAKFTLTDAYFGNRINDKFDFYLTIQSPYYTADDQGYYEISQGSVPVHSVKVTRHAKSNPITHYAWTEESGNTFEWFKKEKIIHNEFINTTDKEITADITFHAITSDQVDQWRKTETITFAPKETKVYDLNVDTDYCQQYTLYVDIKNQSEKINSNLESIDFAIVKTDPDGVQNRSFYFAAHFNNYTDEEDDLGMDVIRKSNAWGVRTEFGWTAVDDIGSFSYDPKEKQFHEKLAIHNLHLLAIWGFSVTHYTGGWLWIPETDEAIARWAEAAEYAASITKGVIDRYEIWNEPNIGAFNGGVGGGSHVVKTPPEIFAKASNAAYLGLKKGNPDVSVGVMSLCGIKNSASYDFFRRAMGEDMEMYMDAITLHPYGSAPTETDNLVKDIINYRDIVKNEFGREEPFEIWNTEIGFTTTDTPSNTDEKQANNSVRSYMHLHAEDVAQAHVQYNFARKGIVPVHREGNFGTVTGGFEHGDKNNAKFVPRKAFVAVTAMNYLLANSRPDGKLDYSNHDNHYIYRYNSDKFNEQIMCLWSDAANAMQTLDLGTKELTYVDVYGNEEKLYSDDGKYTFLLTGRPFYLKGKIPKVELCEEHKFEFPTERIKIVTGDNMLVTLKKGDAVLDCEVEITAPKMFEVSSTKEFDGNTKTVEMYQDSDIYGDMLFRMKILQEGKTVAIADIQYNISEIQTSLLFETSLADLSNPNKWKSNMQITNLSNTEVATGYIQFKGDGLFSKMGKIDIGRIPAGKTGRVAFNFPELPRNGIYNVEYDVVLDNGRVMNYSNRIDFTVSDYNDGKIKIDGIHDAGEWSDKTWMYADNADQVFMSTLKEIKYWGGVDDISAKVNVAWDEENFYMAAVVRDNIHNSDFTAGMSYMGDDIQFGLYHDINQYIATGQAGARYHELGISLANPEGPAIWKWITQTEDTEPGIVTEGVETMVVRGEKETYYETKIPWKTMMGYDYEPKVGEYLGFTYAVNDNDADKDGRRLGVQYAGGIIGGKNANLMSKMKFIKSK